MEGHIHVGIMSGLVIVSYVIVFHFLARTWSGLKPNSPALKGLAYVA
jgi:hypothetical protein